MECVGDPVFAGTRDVARVVSVVLHRWSNVESWGAAFSPCFPFTFAVVDDDSAACRGQWCSIKIELAMDEGIG